MSWNDKHKGEYRASPYSDKPVKKLTVAESLDEQRKLIKTILSYSDALAGGWDCIAEAERLTELVDALRDSSAIEDFIHSKIEKVSPKIGDILLWRTKEKGYVTEEDAAFFRRVTPTGCRLVRLNSEQDLTILDDAQLARIGLMHIPEHLKQPVSQSWFDAVPFHKPKEDQ